MTTNTTQDAQGATHKMTQSGKPDPRESWPETIREKHDKAAAALCKKAQEAGWTPRALERMLDALKREHDALARAAQERHRMQAESRKIEQAQKSADRKKATQEKIIMGALAQRAGVACVRVGDRGDIDRAVFLGAMLDLSEQFKTLSESDMDATIQRWRNDGQRAFTKGE
jgi:hypothetical protein